MPPHVDRSLEMKRWLAPTGRQVLEQVAEKNRRRGVFAQRPIERARDAQRRYDRDSSPDSHLED